jgi:hypothetical protein
MTRLILLFIAALMVGVVHGLKEVQETASNYE